MEKYHQCIESANIPLKIVPAIIGANELVYITAAGDISL